MIEQNEIIKVGKFLRTHALKGELNAVTDDFDSEILDQDYPLIVDMEGIYVPFYAESVRTKGSQGCLVKLEGIDSQERAKEFVNKDIFMLRKDIAELLDIDEDEVATDDELIGMKVYDSEHGFLGIVKGIDDTTANLLLLIDPGNRKDTIYVPFVEDFIEEIDYDDSHSGEKSIRLRLPEGIVDLNQSKTDK